MKNNKHYVWHYLLMVLVSEVVNLVWLGVGIAATASGYVIFSFSPQDFYRLALGMPLMLIGISVILFKLFELFGVLSPARIRSICIYCIKKLE